MRTKAKEYIINNWGENWTRVQWNSDDVIDALAEFAEQQVKKLNIPAVSKQSELLCGFFEPINDSSSETICKHCGREKWMHPKAT